MSDLPEHVAIIMDGNGRWAQQRQMKRVYGHYHGKQTLERIVRYANECDIKILSVFAFSTENSKRPSFEVRALMRLMKRGLIEKVDELHQNNTRLRIIGDRSYFPKKIQKLIQQAEDKTAHNDARTLVVAANYGGRSDIAQAARQLAHEAVEGRLKPEAIDENLMHQYLACADLPEPDLLIRTSGEKRLSNFYLWQLAYTELYFTDILWPDFDENTFDKAIQAFQARKRRYGSV